MKFIIAAAVALATMCAAPASAQAPSAAATALSACLVRATSPTDHILLTQWIFITMSRHPSVTQMTNITDAQSMTTNRQMGALVNRLLLDDCGGETRAAVRVDGPQVIEGAFETLGRAAMGSLMGHPDVAAGVGGFAGYLDQQRLAAILTK